MANDVKVEMTTKDKKGSARTEKFTIAQANALLKMKNPQWKLSDKNYKVANGEVVKA